MSDVLSEQKEHILLITLNRISKHNAFDDVLLRDLQGHIDKAESDASIRVVILKANGQHFSAGADLGWMQRMANYDEQQNIADAMILANVMYSLYHLSKPTIAMVQGAAMGGGAGLVAACDIAIAADTARFCFSEVKLGLIPAVISPYVIKAIGERAAIGLFTSAESFDSQRALELQLIQHRVPEDTLLSYTLQYANQIATCAPLAVKGSKQLVRQVGSLPINEILQQLTADLIAKKRVSPEGQRGLKAFLNKETPTWD